MAAADHLRVARKHGLFLHHGIDLGDGTVAHYLEGKKIIRSSIEEFKCGEPIFLVKHKQSSIKSLTLRRAMSRIGEQKYNLLFNNCEHFANWCKTGRHRSHQIEAFLEKSSVGAFAIGQIVPAAFLSGFKLMLQQGLDKDSSREKAKKSLKQLTDIKMQLISKLELTIEKAETWIQKSTKTNKKQSTNQAINESILLTAQIIADKVASIEELEEQINIHLNQTNKSI